MKHKPSDRPSTVLELDLVLKALDMKMALEIETIVARARQPHATH